MKKTSVIILAIILALSCLFGCVSTIPTDDPSNDTSASDASDTTVNTTADQTSDPASDTTDAGDDAAPIKQLDKDRPYSFLFIGNSYTHYNNMPEQYFSSIMKAAGYTASVRRITKGGWYLIDSAKSTDEVGAKIDSALASSDFDYVILQEQSSCPASDPGKFYTGVRNLYKKIKADGATPILYGTWGRKAGHSTLTSNEWTNESMTWMVSAAYAAIGEELFVDVAYAGLAFFDIYTNHPEIELYDSDLTHPSTAGSYLAALTLFARITGNDPTELNYNGGLSAEKAAIVKEAARKAVFETPEIPDNYKISSVGVEYSLNYTVDADAMKNLTAIPSQNKLISVLTGGSYPNGKSFSGILGTKNSIASTKYSLTGLSANDKADIADIGYGVSVIGIEKMFSDSKGYTTAVENLVNGHWGSSLMACFEFDEMHYNIDGTPEEKGNYTGLITLNFGSKHSFDAFGFSSGSLKGFPGVAEVFVSDDGKNWERVPTASWDNVNGKKLVSCGKTPADPWNANAGTVTCLFDMSGVTGQYIRLGVIIGRNDEVSKYNTINTREILVYGSKIS